MNEIRDLSNEIRYVLKMIHIVNKKKYKFPYHKQNALRKYKYELKRIYQRLEKRVDDRINELDEDTGQHESSQRLDVDTGQNTAAPQPPSLQPRYFGAGTRTHQ